MFDAISPSEAEQRRLSRVAAVTSGATPRLQRSAGRVHLSVDHAGGKTAIRRLSQEGSARLCFPNVAGGVSEAVLVNTSGGLAGGDCFAVEMEAGEGARLTLTTQAAEKVYRTADVAAQVVTTLKVARQARLDWLPQEAILFDEARLVRNLDAEIEDDAALLIAESVVFGRTARGEAVKIGLFADRWRIRRNGRLIFAEQALFSGDIAAQLAKPAIAAGGAAIASVVYAAPDAEARLDDLRIVLRETVGAEGGISAWNGLLAMRLVAADGHVLRKRLIVLLRKLRGIDMPRAWLC